MKEDQKSIEEPGLEIERKAPSFERKKDHGFRPVGKRKRRY